MTEPVFQIGADGIDAERLTAEIQAAVDAKVASGAYADARIARAERLNLFGPKGDGHYSEYFLRCLRDAAEVDINDFEIRERRAALAPILVRLKKGIWSLLRFYTYRLWSQQNQVNGMLVTGIESVDEQYRERLARLEARVAELERRAGGGGGA